jgi:hypothetical protein
MGMLVNKSGTSDGSGNQLIAWANTRYLLQTRVPDSNLVPGVIQLVPHLGLTEAWILVFLRVPNASTGIFFVSWIRKFTSRAHSCAYNRPCRMDPEVLPSWSLRPRHSSIWSRRTCLENIILLRALFGCFITQIFWVVYSTSRKSLLMGLKCKFIIWCWAPMMKSNFALA